MELAIAIDLGTTNTVVAFQLDEDGPRLLSLRQPVYDRRRADALDEIKSAVTFESRDDAVVGAFAARRLDAFRSIKSRMGSRWRASHPYDATLRMPPAYIQAHVLKAVVDQVLAQFPNWNCQAVVTVPASFSTEQRHDTLNAAGLAGLKDVRLLDEPTAAFYLYLEQNRDELSLEGETTVAVVDMGGGTLDVSVIKCTARSGLLEVDAIGRSRYNDLGGDDIDRDIAAFMLACWESESGSTVADLPADLRRNLVAMLVERSRSYKEEVEDSLREGGDVPELFVSEEVTSVDGRLPVEIAKNLNRAHYDELTSRYTGTKTETNIYRPISQALHVAEQIDSNFRREKIDLVLYTGGATRIASVATALVNRFAPVPCLSLDEDMACNTVALGAAAFYYDQLNRKESVSVSFRLLETILTRDEQGGYIPLVPLDCQPGNEFVAVNHDFRFPSRAISLVLPLFRGTDPSGLDVTPMVDLRLVLKTVVDAGTHYSLHYRMNKTKIIEIKAVVGQGEQRFETTESINRASAHRERTFSACLASVNI
jgi:molecular chaperone DnaK